MLSFILLGVVLGLLFRAIAIPVVGHLVERLTPLGDPGRGLAIGAVLVILAVALQLLLLWKLAPMLVQVEALSGLAFFGVLMGNMLAGIISVAAWRASN